MGMSCPVSESGLRASGGDNFNETRPLLERASLSVLICAPRYTSTNETRAYGIFSRNLQYRPDGQMENRSIRLT
jgi:hypothetical protein